MGLYPILLEMSGRRALVVGGGKVALRKVNTLLESGAEVTVVSPNLTDELRILAQQEAIVYRKKNFVPMDAQEFFLVVCATNDKKINMEAAKCAKQAGALVHVVDSSFKSDFQVPAQVCRGDLLFTVSTGGKSPEMAKQLCRELKRIYGEEYGQFLDVVYQLRAELKELHADSAGRETFWRENLTKEAFDLLRSGELCTVEERLKNAIGSFRPQS